MHIGCNIVKRILLSEYPSELGTRSLHNLDPKACFTLTLIRFMSQQCTQSREKSTAIPYQGYWLVIWGSHSWSGWCWGRYCKCRRAWRCSGRECWRWTFRFKEANKRINKTRSQFQNRENKQTKKHKIWEPLLLF